jgi:NitT/TauT family transport system substrate-binding protein
VPNLAHVFSLLLLLVAPACLHEEKEPLIVATLLWPGSEPLFLARDLGYADDGSIRLVAYSTAQGEAPREFRNGGGDAAFITYVLGRALEEEPPAGLGGVLGSGSEPPEEDIP